MALGSESGAEIFEGRNQTILNAASTTTQVKATAGKLAKIIITTAPATFVIYDDASANNNQVWGIATAGVYDVQIPMNNGIRCVTGTGTTLIVLVWT